MVVQCPSCQTKFRIADEKVTDRGVRVRCTSCKNVFQVKKSGIESSANQASTGMTQELQALRFGPDGELLSNPPAPTGKTAPTGMKAPPLSRPPGPASAPPGTLRPPGQPIPANQRPVISDSQRLPGMRTLGPPLSNPPLPSMGTPGASRPPPPASSPRLPAVKPPSSPSLPQAGSKPPPSISKAPPPLSRPPPAAAITPPPSLRSAPPLPSGSAPGAMARRRPSSISLDETPEAPKSPASIRSRPSADDLFGMDELTGESKPLPGSPLSSNPDHLRVPSIPPAPSPSSGPSLSVAPPPAPAEAAPPPPPAPGEEAPPEPPSDPDGPVKLGAIKTTKRDPFEGVELSDPASAPLQAEEPPALAPTEPPPAMGLSDPNLPRPLGRELVAVGLTGLIGIAVALALYAAAAAVHFAPPWMHEGPPEPLVATQIASGLYDVSGPRPVFFVRGRVENRSGHALGAVRVVADLLDDGNSVARIETVAGAEPTAEQVHALRSAEEAEALSAQLAHAGAGAKLAPGESAPFFALIPEPPAHAERDALRVTVVGDEAK